MTLAMLLGGVIGPAVGAPSPAPSATSSSPTASGAPTKNQSPSASGSAVAPPTTSTSPGFEQIKQCIDQADPISSLSSSVSWAQRQLQYTKLWPLSQGRGVKVAVIDTGVNQVPALEGRLHAGGDLIMPRSAEPGLADCDGHGTLVAGLIAGAQNPATGFAGVAPKATIISIRQNSLAYKPKDAPNRQESTGTEATLAKAVTLAVDKGASIINISAAQCGSADARGVPALVHALNFAASRDVLVVAAAGNLGSSGRCKYQNVPGRRLLTRADPASIPGVLAVGSVGKDGKPSEFSLAGPWVGISAPGEEIISVNPHSGTGGEVDRIVGVQGASKIQGTSFAAPYISGIAALIRARYPKLSARQVAARLQNTAGPAAGTTGRSFSEGNGIVDPARALTAVVPAEAGGAVPTKTPVRSVAAPKPDQVAADRNVALEGSGIVLLALSTFITLKWFNRGAHPRQKV